MQVDPIKPTLKAPGTKRLKLKCDEPLLNFAFNSKLRRYNMAMVDWLIAARADVNAARSDGYTPLKVGRCRLTLSHPNRKRLELSA